MYWQIHLRRLGLLFLGLALLAQVAAVIPFLSVQTQHVIENAQDIAADLAEGGGVHHQHHHHHRHGDGGRHEHGSADPNDQCCTLHNHMAGVLPVAAGAGRRNFTTAIVAVASRLPSGADPGALERPPKLTLSI